MAGPGTDWRSSSPAKRMTSSDSDPAQAAPSAKAMDPTEDNSSDEELEAPSKRPKLDSAAEDEQEAEFLPVLTAGFGFLHTKDLAAGANK